MTNRFLHNFLLISLLSGNCYAAPGDKVCIQLLPDDKDLQRVYQKASLRLKQENCIPFPHVSFIQIADDNDIIKNNYSLFVEKISNSLMQNKTDLIEFLGKSIDPFVSEHTGQTFWCLKNNNNIKLTKAGNNIKLAIDTFISDHNKNATPSPVMFSKGFPHISLAKGANINKSLFSRIENEDINIRLKGFKFIYTFYNEIYQIPQVYLSKDFTSTSNYILQHKPCEGKPIFKQSSSIGLLEINSLLSSIDDQFQKTFKENKQNSDVEKFSFDLSFLDKETPSRPLAKMPLTEIITQTQEIKARLEELNAKRQDSKKRMLEIEDPDEQQQRPMKKLKLSSSSDPLLSDSSEEAKMEQDEKQAPKETQQETTPISSGTPFDADVVFAEDFGNSDFLASFYK